MAATLRNQLRRLTGSDVSAILPNLKRRAANSVAAVQDTYLCTKDVFERHRVVFTVSTSIASVLTAWAGYSLRHYHQANVEKRLESIEHAMKTSHDIERKELKRIIHSGTVGSAACLATAGTTLVIGYALGWRGGAWYANRKFRKEQMKLMGQIKPNKWRFIKRPLIRPKLFGSKHKESVSSSALAKRNPAADSTQSLQIGSPGISVPERSM